VYRERFSKHFVDWEGKMVAIKGGVTVNRDKIKPPRRDLAWGGL